jgi:hypothetical protein
MELVSGISWQDESAKAKVLELLERKKSIGDLGEVSLNDISSAFSLFTDK